MSAGKVHTLASIALSTGFTVAALATYDIKAVEYAAGAVIGVFIQPDCDVDKGFIAYHYIRQRLGDWAEFIWDKIWFMYRRSIKHGSELSHFPVVGTLGRLAYLFLFGIIIPYAILDIFFNFDIWSELKWWANFAITNWRIILGLIGADFIHFVLDIATVDGKFDINSLLSMSPVPKRKVRA